MPETDTEAPVVEEPKQFTCVRCGFVYQKLRDYEPYLCHRCLRFLGKKVYTMVHTIVPAMSRPTESAEV